MPFHASAFGKVFLALGVVHLPPGALEQRTRPRTITDREALEAELDLVRARGYAAAATSSSPGSRPSRRRSATPPGDVSPRCPSPARRSACRADAASTRSAALRVEQAAALGRELGTPPGTEGAA